MLKKTTVISIFLLFLSPVFSGSTLKIRSLDLGGLKWNLDESLLERHKNMIPDLRDGMKHLDGLFENPMVTEALTLWTVSKKESLPVVLGKGLGVAPDADGGVGVYRKGNQAALILDDTVDSDFVARFILSEYAKLLMDARSPRFSTDRVAWFYTGCSAALGWSTPGILRGHPESDSLDEVIRYYGFFVNPEEGIPLATLKAESDWTARSDREPRVVQATSAISCSWLLRKQGRTGVSSLLRKVERGDDFESAMKSVFGVDSVALESELIHQVFPAIRKSYRTE